MLCQAFGHLFLCFLKLSHYPGIFKGLETKWSFSTNILILQVWKLRDRMFLRDLLQVRKRGRERQGLLNFSLWPTIFHCLLQTHLQALQTLDPYWWCFLGNFSWNPLGSWWRLWTNFAKQNKTKQTHVTICYKVLGVDTTPAKGILQLTKTLALGLTFCFSLMSRCQSRSLLV